MNAPYQSRRFGSLGLGNLDAYDRGRGDGSHSATLIGSFQVSCRPSPLEQIHHCSSVVVNGDYHVHPRNTTSSSKFHPKGQNTSTVLRSGDGKVPPRATEFEKPHTLRVSDRKISPFFSENFTNRVLNFIC